MLLAADRKSSVDDTGYCEIGFLYQKTDVKPNQVDFNIPEDAQKAIQEYPAK